MLIVHNKTISRIYSGRFVCNKGVGGLVMRGGKETQSSHHPLLLLGRRREGVGGALIVLPSLLLFGVFFLSFSWLLSIFFSLVLVQLGVVYGERGVCGYLASSSPSSPVFERRCDIAAVASSSPSSPSHIRPEKRNGGLVSRQPSLLYSPCPSRPGFRFDKHVKKIFRNLNEKH